jgi:hypothetical protein
MRQLGFRVYLTAWASFLNALFAQYRESHHKGEKKKRETFL